VDSKEAGQVGTGSDVRYRLLVESVKDYAIFLLDTSGRVLSWNQGAERIKGFRADEIIGEHFSRFYPPEDKGEGKPERELAFALRHGRVEDEGWRVRKDGTRFWANVVITALFDETGKHVGFAKVTRDLTERSFRTFVEATNTIVWTADPEGKPNADSPSWRAFTGQSPEAWRGPAPWEPVHPDDAPAMKLAWERAAAEKSVFEHEQRIRRFDGAWRWMRARAVPFADGEGDVREWFGVLQDVTARHEAETARDRELVRWTTTLKSIGDAVITTDRQGRIAFMNATAEQLTHWTAEEASGRPLEDIFAIVNEETRHRVENPVQKVLREGGVVGLANHTVLVRPDGSDLPIDDSAAPIRFEDGGLDGVVLVFRDKSEEKREEVRRLFLARAGEALSASEDYREALRLVAQLAVPRLADLCTVDIVEPGGSEARQLAVAHADPAKLAFARQLGSRYPPDPKAPRGAANVIRTGKSELYAEITPEMIALAAGGDEHRALLEKLSPRSAMVVPLRGRGRVLGALSFLRCETGLRYGPDDVAFAENLASHAALVIERRLLEEEREQLLERERVARAEAERANRAKDEFLATVSHELRTPLNAILGWSVMLRRKRLAPDVERVLAIIERNARAQARLIDDGLDVSRIISGKLRLEMGSADVGEAVTTATEGLRPVAEQKGVTLRASIDPQMGDIVGDRERLQQIVWNLVSNAIKFTPSGGEVHVEARQVSSVVRIVVRDTGQGFDPRLKSNIFEPFRQADASTTRRHGGLGLGLAIVRQLVVAHGGVVSAESEGERKGATFVVELPARPQATLRRAPSGPRVAREERPRLGGLRVLVVDDDADARELLSALLAAHGADVDLAGSAQEALTRFSARRPDLVVSDIGMPLVDGYALLREIRAKPEAEGGRTPALALTAYARSEDIDLAFEAGFQAHIAKPVEPDELVAMVASLAAPTP
jgi:PAS domain S-box-containing protein